MPKITITFEDGETLGLAARTRETVLAAARRKGLALSADCEVGDCQTCRATLVAGRVEYDEDASVSLTEAEMAAGEVLLCVASPETDVTVGVPYGRGSLIRPKPFSVKIAALERCGASVMRVRGRVTAIKPIRFFAGQYVNIRVPGLGAQRAYSMASAPSQGHDVEFLVRLFEEGTMSSYLAGRARDGDILDCEGPYGTFYLREGDAPLLMVAGGTGVAPMASMLRELAESAPTRKVTLCFGVNRLRDLFYMEALRETGDRLAAFELRVAIAEGASGEAWRSGYVTDLLEPSDLAGCDVYLCGPPAMIEAAHGLLGGAGVVRNRIFVERFLPATVVPASGRLVVAE